MIFIAAEYYKHEVWLNSNVFIFVELFFYLYRKVSALTVKQFRYSDGIHRTLFEI
jgi:hypothetical protein